MFVIVILYFLPSIIAMCKRKRNDVAIGVMNLLLGWTGIGWVVALIWACTNDVKPVVMYREESK
jgi:hypothetical protein